MSVVRLTVGVDVREWEPDSSTGIARHLTGFLSWCAEHGRGHRFLLLGNQETEFRVAGERLVHLRLAEGSRLAWDQLHLPAALARGGADVFLSPYYKLPLRAPCRVVVTVHDLIPLHFGDDPHRATSTVAFLRRLWMGFLVRRADRVVTDSKHSREEVVATLGISRDRIRVVPPGLAPSLGNPPSEEDVERALGRYDLRPGYVFYVGRHTPHKNVELLVGAWSALDPALRRAHPLVLAGRGADRHRTGGDVRTVGRVDDDDLPGLYAGARVFAFPSCHEGFGFPPLEAMGCGTAVVCSNATSLPEVCGDAALLLPPDDLEAWSRGLVELLTDTERRALLIRRGRAQARRFALARTAPGLLSVLEETAGHGGPQSGGSAPLEGGSRA